MRTTPAQRDDYCTRTNNPHTAVLPSWVTLTWSALISAFTLWPFWRALWPDAGTGDEQAFMLRDMFASPTLALNLPALGAGNTPPRAIPQDTLLALASPIIAADTLLALIVITAAILGGWGASRLAARAARAIQVADIASSTHTRAHALATTLGAQFLAPLLVIWTPYTIERFLQGQWSVSAAAMLLPTVAYLALGPSTARTQCEHAHPARWGALGLVVAVCAITPTGIILSTIVALVFARRWAQRAAIALVAALLASPWILAAVFSSASSTADPLSATAFAAGPVPAVNHAVGPLSTLVTLLGLGGMWNVDAIATSRGGLAVAAGALLVFALTVVGVMAARRERPTRQLTRTAIMLLIAALLIPAALATPPGLALMGTLLEYLPGAGLFRDTSKFVALALPALVVLLGIAAVELSRLARHITSANVCTLTVVAPMVAAALVVLASVPGYTTDIRDAAQQPLSRDLEEIREIIAAEPESAIALLPPGNYRTRADGVSSIDPALKLLPGEPIDPGYLIVDGRIVDGDLNAMAVLRELYNGEDHLAERGIGWVLVDHKAGSASDLGEAEAVLDQQRTAFSSERYTLYRTARAVDYQPRSATPTIIGLALYGVTVVAAAVSVGVGAARSVRTRRETARQWQDQRG